MKAILQPNEGERVVLSAPLCGDILVKTDPAVSGGSLVMAVQTLPPAGTIPVHRYLHHPLFVWVAKGQGRVTVEVRSYTVVPGNALVIPAGQWYGLRNTGTGLFQVVWVAPSSVVSFFRSLGQASQPLSHAALQTLAQPYGIEFQSDRSTKPVERRPPHARRHHNRGHRRRPVRSALPASGQAMASPESPGTPRASAPAAASRQPPMRKPSGHRRSSGRQGHVKEVFMNGRWVKVSGEGPIIASSD